MPIYVTQNCSVVGFLKGLVDRSLRDHVLPIYKVANIASEPSVDFQGKPIVLIDGNTREGTSGAPVFAQDISVEGRSCTTRILGIYTGRYVDERGKEDSTLGFVFKPRTISEVFEAMAQDSRIGFYP